MKKQIVKIKLDYLQGPIWLSDISTGKPLTGIDIIDNDEKIRELNYKISEMFSSYYEFDSHDQACWFNYEQERKDKEKMLSLLKQLNDRLNEINDGSFKVKDLETERVKKLLHKHIN